MDLNGYLSSVSLSVFLDSVLSYLWLSAVNFDFRWNLAYCNLIHQLLYQSFQAVPCLAYNLLQSIWIFREICLIVILLIHMLISLSRQCLVSSLTFSQFGCSRKSVLLSFHWSAFISVFPDSFLSCPWSSSVNLDFWRNLSYWNLIHQPIYQSFQAVSCLSCCQ